MTLHGLTMILAAALVVAGIVSPAIAADSRLVLNEKWEELPPVSSSSQAVTPGKPRYVQMQGEHRSIDYRYKHPRHGRFSKCDTSVVALLINDPCSGCLVEVPICVPNCCLKDAPSICWSTGAFHRDVVTYSWPCGYDVRIAFRNKSDALIVTYGQLQR